jgi:hypothetical protein
MNNQLRSINLFLDLEIFIKIGAAGKTGEEDRQ